MNSIVAWDELAKSMKLLISALDKVYTEKISSINLVRSRCVSICAIKMTMKATAHSYSVRLLDLSVQLLDSLSAPQEVRLWDLFLRTSETHRYVFVVMLFS